MRAKQIALAALAASVLLAGAAGAVTAQPGPNADDASDEPGPPEETPGGPPSFVSDIHDAISEFLSGSVDHLGSVVSDATPGDDGADGEAGEDGTESGGTAEDGATTRPADEGPGSDDETDDRAG